MATVLHFIQGETLFRSVVFLADFGQIIFNGPCFYNFSFLLYHFYVRAFLLTTESFFKSYLKSNAVRPTAVRMTWNEISRLKRRFEDCMSSYPMLWLTNVFVVSCITLDRIVKGRFEMGREQLMELRPVVSDFAMVVSVVIHVDYVDTKVKQMYETFYHDIAGRAASQDHRKMANEIEKEYPLGFTAYSFFNLDRKVLISFVTALINMNVLVIQMTP
ncbi:hypothetical protein HDE_12194 [Halotydeus destructor]|nr:hypothetical protein HDE_12194 [Halotydeus destructor]